MNSPHHKPAPVEEVFPNKEFSIILDNDAISSAPMVIVNSNIKHATILESQNGHVAFQATSDNGIVRGLNEGRGGGT